MTPPRRFNRSYLIYGLICIAIILALTALFGGG